MVQPHAEYSVGITNKQITAKQGISQYLRVISKILYLKKIENVCISGLRRGRMSRHRRFSRAVTALCNDAVNIMMTACHHTFVQTHRRYVIKGETQWKLWTLVIMVC